MSLSAIGIPNSLWELACQSGMSRSASSSQKDLSHPQENGDGVAFDDDEVTIVGIHTLAGLPRPSAVSNRRPVIVLSGDEADEESEFADDGRVPLFASAPVENVKSDNRKRKQTELYAPERIEAQQKKAALQVRKKARKKSASDPIQVFQAEKARLQVTRNGNVIAQALKRIEKGYHSAGRQGPDIGEMAHFLGEVYQFGQYGKKMDQARAEEYFVAAARRHQRRGSWGTLACFYEGQEKRKEAFEAWQEHDKTDDTGTALNVQGIFWEKGLHGAPDPEKAYAAFVAGDEKGNIEAKFNLARCFENGIGCPRNFTDAAALYVELGEKSDIVCFYNLGALHSEGRIRGTIDWNEALCCFEQAIRIAETSGKEDKAIYAYYEAAQILRKNKSEVVDDARAVKYYKKADELGHEDAAYFLGKIYHYGLCGVVKNTKTAERYYKKVSGEYKHKALEELVNLTMI